MVGSMKRIDKDDASNENTTKYEGELTIILV